MQILIVSDAFPPMRTSCATQIYDLTMGFVSAGHFVTVVMPANDQIERFRVVQHEKWELISVKGLKFKGVGLFRRTFAELLNPIIMRYFLLRNREFLNNKYDVIAWYSPTIFWGFLIRALKNHFHCRAYLILRDIFPDWAYDIGIIRSRIIYAFFKFFEYFQYKQADKIGVQSPNNLNYLETRYPELAYKFEVLWNWLAQQSLGAISTQLNLSSLHKKKIFVYAGNIGVAQGVDNLITFCKAISNNPDVGCIFIGRGSEKITLENFCQKEGWSNILFFDEVPPNQLLSLYEQCDIGLFSLALTHNTHNIPGKVISYLRSGLPVLGFINAGNDLVEIIQKNNLGYLIKNENMNETIAMVDKILELIDGDHSISQRCKKYAELNFSVSAPMNQILNLTLGK